jgi:hypothetical protein
MEVFMDFTTSSATPLMLTAWSTTTTLADWEKLPVDLRKRTARAAASLPYTDNRRRKDKQQNAPYNRRKAVAA